jgi:hypothetical protein
MARKCVEHEADLCSLAPAAARAMVFRVRLAV